MLPKPEERLDMALNKPCVWFQGEEVTDLLDLNMSAIDCERWNYWLPILSSSSK